MQDLKVTLIQSDIQWAAPEKNTTHLDNIINTLKEESDLIILPEMFSTGFNMNPSVCYETMDGFTIQWMKEKAGSLNCVICGSLLIKENSYFVNRFIWMRADGSFEYYDKKHLFRLSGEHKVFDAGNRRVIAELNGFRFLLQICYDLRFPVFSRNRYQDGHYDYDCIIYVANWPASRSYAWKQLSIARAIENQSYVIAVNRIGTDINGTAHSGDSAIISPLGELISQAPADKQMVLSAIIDKESLDSYRKRFLAAADWDNFDIKI